MSARVCFRPTDSDCFSGICHKDCSHRMWVCDTCRCEGGWGAPVAQLQEWADAHECPPVSAHEMTDEYTPTTEEVMRGFRIGPVIDPRTGETLLPLLTRRQKERWLTAHDARIASEAAETAWDEGWGDCWNFHQSEGMKGREDNPYAAEREGDGKGES